MTKPTTEQVFNYISELINEQTKIAHENKDISDSLKAIKIASILIKVNMFIATGKK